MYIQAVSVQLSNTFLFDFLPKVMDASDRKYAKLAKLKKTSVTLKSSVVKVFPVQIV
jgi:hypothetical protein